ncbi:glycoside hydrolase family 104 protein [Herbaspirillum chlorophenolicum]|uniref:Glycoside hydrolase family 104 protein n=1 Tax=Herbaspirillum chlorophenolicum TaxID=211589 RepID=A0ABW8EV38_9BURK
MDNRKAFLDTIAFSELGSQLIKISDNGYNVIVGSTPLKPILFSSYADHPRRLVHITANLASTAAGRYQLLARYFDAYKKLLGLPDFSPASQDAIALQQIREGRALDDVDAGRFDIAVGKVRNIWASLPGAGYGQRENKIEILRAQFAAAGGRLA